MVATLQAQQSQAVAEHMRQTRQRQIGRNPQSPNMGNDTRNYGEDSRGGVRGIGQRGAAQQQQAGRASGATTLETTPSVRGNDDFRGGPPPTMTAPLASPAPETHLAPEDKDKIKPTRIPPKRTVKNQVYHRPPRLFPLQQRSSRLLLTTSKRGRPPARPYSHSHSLCQASFSARPPASSASASFARLKVTLSLKMLIETLVPKYPCPPPPPPRFSINYSGIRYSRSIFFSSLIGPPIRLARYSLLVRSDPVLEEALELHLGLQGDSARKRFVRAPI